VLLAAWPDKTAHLGATVPTVAVGTAFLYEALMTAFLAFVVFAVATDTRAVGVVAALAVAATVGCDALFGGPLTGASMNPARSLGPAVASGTWTEFWIYVAAPLVGALAGGLAYTYVRGSRRAVVPAPEPAGDGVVAISRTT
jgi:aquaporin NIP